MAAEGCLALVMVPMILLLLWADVLGQIVLLMEEDACLDGTPKRRIANMAIYRVRSNTAGEAYRHSTTTLFVVCDPISSQAFISSSLYKVHSRQKKPDHDIAHHTPHPHLAHTHTTHTQTHVVTVMADSRKRGGSEQSTHCDGWRWQQWQQLSREETAQQLTWEERQEQRLTPQEKRLRVEEKERREQKERDEQDERDDRDDREDQEDREYQLALQEKRLTEKRRSNMIVGVVALMLMMEECL